MISLLFAQENGELLDFPDLQMVARLGDELVVPEADELIPLPEGATLTMVPGRFPIGIDKKGNLMPLKHHPYLEKQEPVYAVAALLPQGFTRTLLPAIASGHGDKRLPLLGYTAVGIDENGQFWIGAKQTDSYDLWHPKFYNTPDLPQLVEKKCAQFPGNRLIQQLGKCALEYGCFTAQNMFYERWEAGLPVSPRCNANCLGCISLQPSECCPSPQSRIDFIPETGEVALPAIAHLEKDQNNIVSFGQGCEGEPSLSYPLITAAIKEIRSKVGQGTINMNTNCGYTNAIRQIVDAGIDTMRISLFSADKDHYAAYHQPCEYGLDTVRENAEYAHAKGVTLSMNLLCYPGFTDRESEIEKIIDFVRATGISLIQMRNLNIDPDIISEKFPGDAGLGVLPMLEILKDELPGVGIGNFSRPKEK
ncbi:MAG: radical SAM protein [Peptococcaceae bacterium]|jgi:pyruvate-formate lyase-activating enzyme|nr:radical SAM protein [Peptococcaceae bacterium]